MKIQHISTSDNNINYRGTKQITKMAIGAITTGFAATLGKHKTDEQQSENEFFYDDLSDVKEVDDNIFDEEYYQAYYNIDLNLAHNRAFRDNELFNPLRDNENFKYKQYDKDDIEHADNLLYKNNINKYTTEYKLADTDIGRTKLPDAVTNPQKKTSDEIKILQRFIDLNKKVNDLKINEETKNKILNSCKQDIFGYYEVDYSLVDMALNLYNNSKQWEKQENAIMQILKSSNPIDFYKFDIFIKTCMLAHLSNSKILQNLKNMIKKDLEQCNLQSVTNY